MGSYRLAPFVEFETNIWTEKYRYPYLNTSLISLFTDPGIISEKAWYYFDKIETLDDQQKNMHAELCKFPYIEFWKKNVTKNDYLVVSFSTEFYTKFYDTKECVTLLPQFQFGLAADWFKILLHDAKFHLQFDDKLNLGLTREMLVDFSKTIYDIFEDRVVLVDTHLSDNVLIDKKSVSNSPVNFKNIPYYQNNRFSYDPKNRNYGKRLITAMIKEFKRKFSGDVPVITIPDSFVYRDSTHRWGNNPFHLHQSTTNMIGCLVFEHIQKHRRKLKKVENEIRIF